MKDLDRGNILNVVENVVDATTADGQKRLQEMERKDLDRGKKGEEIEKAETS